MLQPVLLRGLRLVLNQWCAMFKKRFNYSRRNWLTLLLQVFSPVVIIIFIGRLDVGKYTLDLPPLTISLASYKNAIAVVENPKTADASVTRYLQLKFKWFQIDFNFKIIRQLPE